MSTVIVVASILLNPGIKEGWASQYANGVMERVVYNRQHGCCGRWALPQDDLLPHTDGYVARPHPQEIGSVIWLRPVGRGAWESFLVVDCGGVADGGRSWMLDNRILVEVDYQTAQRWNTIGRGIRVQMSYYRPLSPAQERLWHMESRLLQQEYEGAW